VSVRVIVTEKNGLIRGVLVDALHEAGFEVVAQCGSAEEALAAAARGNAEVLTTNVLLSGSTDGYALTAQLHADRPELPVIIHTSFAGDEHIARARDAGASGFLSKGGDVEILIAAVGRVAAGGTWFPGDPAARPDERR
jgi:DNA-binding NarL/FixJ family response regulator